MRKVLLFSFLFAIAGCSGVDTNEEPATADGDDDDDGSTEIYALTSGTFAASGLQTIADGCGVGDQATMEPIEITVQGSAVDIGGMQGTIEENVVSAQATEPMADPSCPLVVTGLFDGTLLADDEIESVLAIQLGPAPDAPAGCAAQCETTFGFRLTKQ